MLNRPVNNFNPMIQPGLPSIVNQTAIKRPFRESPRHIFPVPLKPHFQNGIIALLSPSCAGSGGSGKVQAVGSDWTGGLVGLQADALE